MKVWKSTKYRLKLLAALRSESMSATLHELVSDALAAEQEKRES